MSPMMNSICKKYFFKANPLFAVKVMINNDAGKSYTVVALVSVYIYAFSIRVFERELSEYTEKNFHSIFNSIWFVLVTMTTVGYGDYVSVTTEGRILTLLACISGSFFMSFTLLTLSNIITFSNEENNLHEILSRIKGNKIIKETAYKVIEELIVFNKVIHNKTNSIANQKDYKNSLLDYLRPSISNYVEADMVYGRGNQNDNSLVYFLSEINIILKEVEGQYVLDQRNLEKLKEIDEKLSKVINEKL